jgi:hypothetical protein
MDRILLIPAGYFLYFYFLYNPQICHISNANLQLEFEKEAFPVGVYLVD